MEKKKTSVIFCQFHIGPTHLVFPLLQISINSGIIGDVIKLEIIQKDEQNKDGEIDSITSGKHYVIYRLASSGKLGTFVRKSKKWSPFGSNMWKDKEERDYDPHGCLAKGIENSPQKRLALIIYLRILKDILHVF